MSEETNHQSDNDASQHKRPRRPSRKITPQMAREIRELLEHGHFVNRIAAKYDINPGRVSEIKHGKHPVCMFI